ncbi:MAG: BamA/TamA family outer membrane protein [Cyclobacteriaceae bacterium]
MSKSYLAILLLLPFFVFAQKGDSVRASKSFAIYPALGYQPETSVQFGGLAVVVLAGKDQSQNSFQRESSLTPYFLYTFRNQVLTAANLDYYFKSGFNLNVTPRFFNFPDLYFGIGNENDPEISENYTNVYWQLEGMAFRPWEDIYFFGAAFDFQHTQIKDLVENGLLATDVPVGIEGGALVRLGPAFKFDSRDNVIYPTKGYFIGAQTLFNPIGDFQYSSYILDVRKYINFKDAKHIFAFQLRANFTGGADVPFYKLPQLGGDDRLRGIENASLYRDNQLIYAQAEYRRHLFWRFGGVAFAGVGDVASSIGDFQTSSLKYIVGLGGRFAVIPSKKLNIRCDLGISNEGQYGIYIGMREAF